MTRASERRAGSSRAVPGRALQVLFLSALCLLVSCCGRAAAAAEEPSDQVVLLHGLGRTPASMQSLAEHLARAGYDVHNLEYPSRRETPEVLIEHVRAAVVRCCPAGGGRLHFVTHSLGGILVRALLAERPPPHLGRVVMLAPPNHGSEVVDELGDSALFRAVLGPTATQLGTSPDSLPNRLGPPDFDLGIIAARESLNPIGSALIPGPDDGAVSLESVQLEGANDFLVVDANHTFIMSREDVALQVVHFLRYGRFDRSEKP